MRCSWARVILLALLSASVAVPVVAQTAISNYQVDVGPVAGVKGTLAPYALIMDTGGGVIRAVLTSDYLGFFSNGDLQSGLTQSGVQFADGTAQESAAYTKAEIDMLVSSLQPDPAWPMICKTAVENGILPIAAQEPPATLFCRSPQPGVPGGTIGSGAGVPNGYFFVVTDVLANCRFDPDCDGVDFILTRRNIADSSTDIETWQFPLSATTSGADTFVHVQTSGPMMILEEGDYLVGLGGLSSSGGHAVLAQVMGYLTASPELLRR